MEYETTIEDVLKGMEPPSSPCNKTLDCGTLEAATTARLSAPSSGRRAHEGDRGAGFLMRSLCPRVLASYVVFLFIVCAAHAQNAPLQQQKMCMEQAKRLEDAAQEHENRLQSPNQHWLFTWTNHFNAHDNICYVTSRSWFQEERVTIIGIFNAFEGDTVAFFSSDSTNDCFVEGKKCHSEQEFLSLAIRMQYRKGGTK